LTFQKQTSRLSRKSLHFKNVSLDAKDVLDLDWSRLSRPPCLDHGLRDQLVNRAKLNPIYQSQISFIYLMYVPSSFSYCYHSANETISAMAQSDPIKRLSPSLSLSFPLSPSISHSLSLFLLLSPSLPLSPSLSLSLYLSLPLSFSSLPLFPSFFCLSHIIYLMYVPSSFAYCYHSANKNHFSSGPK
jgi:hypothetical protein